MSRIASSSRAVAASAFIVLASAGEASAAKLLVEERMLTQEGLAIALASTVLQSQLNILVSSFGTSSQCNVLPGGTGSIKMHSIRKIDSHTSRAKTTVYFDRKCKEPYVAADATIDQQTSQYDIAETANYSGPSGTVLGQMQIQEKAILPPGGGIQGVIGLGQFTPANGAVTVDLGLECDFSDLNTQKRKYVAPCEGGIAQDFPDLSQSMASVTPLKLRLKKIGKNNYSVAFGGASSHMVTGDLGALSITTPTNSSLDIGGNYTNYHNDAVTQGFASQFSLFPPTPTDWSITDTKNDAKFSIAVSDNTSRNSSGTVTRISTGEVLATLAMDRSGTGSITYSDGSIQPITSWLLGD